MDIKIKQNPYFLKQGFCQVTIFFVTLHYISQIIVAKLHFFAKYTNLFCCCIFLCMALVYGGMGEGRRRLAVEGVSGGRMSLHLPPQGQGIGIRKTPTPQAGWAVVGDCERIIGAKRILYERYVGG